MKKFVDIKTISGTVNLRTQNAKAHFFHSPRKSGKAYGKEMFLDEASKDGARGGSGGVINRWGSAQFTDSISGTKPEFGGRMVTQGFTIAEDEVIKCFISVRPSYGKMPRCASVFLRVRASAAYRKLRFKLLDSPETVFNSAEIEGTFDVLTTDEALALGVHIPTAYRDFSDPTNVATVLNENLVIIQETEAPVKLERRTLEAEDGTVRTVTQRKRRRMIG